MAARILGKRGLEFKLRDLGSSILLQHKNIIRRVASAAPATLSDFEIQHKQPLAKKTTPIPIALYGGRHAVTMLPGGGIGPELMVYVKEVFKYAGAPIDFEVVKIDPKSDEQNELEYAITSIKRNGVALKGNIETKSESTGVQSRNVAIRNELDLFVNVLHCHSYPGVPARQSNIDVIIIRQNTEGEYAMLEHESVNGVIESMKVVTRSNSERVARFAFEYAKRNNRKKVTTIHKANIMKLSDGLFLDTSRKIAKEYPEIEHNDMIIDNCCMQLVSNPHQFDVMIMTNLYGTIVSNVVCGIVGGAGLLSGKNYGDHYAVFEPGTRNTGTAIAGKNIANPIAMLSAGIDMLDHLGHKQHSELISDAVRKTICEDKLHTPDLGGTASSTEVVQRIIDHILQADIRACKFENKQNVHSYTFLLTKSATGDKPWLEWSETPFLYKHILTALHYQVERSHRYFGINYYGTNKFSLVIKYSV